MWKFTCSILLCTLDKVDFEYFIYMLKFFSSGNRVSSCIFVCAVAEIRSCNAFGWCMIIRGANILTMLCLMCSFVYIGFFYLIFTLTFCALFSYLIIRNSVPKNGLEPTMIKCGNGRLDYILVLSQRTM